ncbi:hypothetical protein AAMO2058_001237700 [Amorphochlora amoebiformis]
MMRANACRRRQRAILHLSLGIAGVIALVSAFTLAIDSPSAARTRAPDLGAHFFDFGDGDNPFAQVLGDHPFFGGGGETRGPPPRQKPKGPIDTTHYYKLLGVTKSATPAEIKRAYYKNSMKMHPDKGGDPKKYKEICEAYECLSNKEKRKAYDSGGKEGVDQQQQMEAQKRAMEAMQRGGREKKMPTLTHKLRVTLEDLYNGKTKRIALRRSRICDECMGKGTLKEDASVTCTTCRGRGQVMRMRQLGRGMIQQIPAACNACGGTGSGIPDADKCRRCRGEGTEQERKIISIHIEAGMDDGEKIVMKGEADQKPGFRNGDLHALCGFAFPIRQLDNRTIWIKSREGVCYSPGSRIVLENEGMAKINDPKFGRGDMIVQFDVEFPKRIDAATREKIKEVLEGPDPDDIPPEAKPPLLLPFDERVMEINRKEREERMNRAKKERKREIYEGADTEDEEEERQRSPFGGAAGGRQVQCASQ